MYNTYKTYILLIYCDTCMNVCVYIIIMCVHIYIYIIYILSSHHHYVRVRLGSATVEHGLKESFRGPSGLEMRILQYKMRGVQQRLSLFQEWPLDGQYQPLKELFC